MPGARIFRMVVAMSTATISPIASVKFTSTFQKSARLPIPNSGPASGTYANQPASAPVLKRSREKRQPADQVDPVAHAVMRGNALLRVPIISGTR
jgi:hypothetical protein